MHFYFHVARTELVEKTDMEVQIRFLVEQEVVSGQKVGWKRRQDKKAVLKRSWDNDAPGRIVHRRKLAVGSVLVGNFRARARASPSYSRSLCRVRALAVTSSLALVGKWVHRQS